MRASGAKIKGSCLLFCIRAGRDECYLVYEQVVMNVTLYTSRS